MFQLINHSGPFSKIGTNQQNQSTDLKGKDKVYVERVVDGDTFVANKDGKEIKVRMIGMDTLKPLNPIRLFNLMGKRLQIIRRKL